LIGCTFDAGPDFAASVAIVVIAHVSAWKMVSLCCGASPVPS
jgi:hypothetical protein